MYWLLLSFVFYVRKERGLDSSDILPIESLSSLFNLMKMWNCDGVVFGFGVDRRYNEIKKGFLDTKHIEMNVRYSKLFSSYSYILSK